MHNGKPQESIPPGDRWLAENLDRYYQWAKTHNSLLIVTFDENDNYAAKLRGLTDPAVVQDGSVRARSAQNRIPTIIAGAHIKPGYREELMVNHITLLRTLEAMYELSRSGRQQPFAARAGVSDDAVLRDVFVPAPGS